MKCAICDKIIDNDGIKVSYGEIFLEFCSDKCFIEFVKKDFLSKKKRLKNKNGLIKWLNMDKYIVINWYDKKDTEWILDRDLSDKEFSELVEDFYHEFDFCFITEILKEWLYEKYKN